MAFALLLGAQSYGSLEATGGGVKIETSLDRPLQLGTVEDRLLPTSDPRPGTGHVATFTLSNTNEVPIAYAIRAEDTSATAGGSQQFAQLYVRVTDADVADPFGEAGATVRYEGLLSGLGDADPIVIPAGTVEVAFEVEGYLLESGAPQPAGAVTDFSLTVLGTQAD